MCLIVSYWILHLVNPPVSRKRQGVGPFPLGLRERAAASKINSLWALEEKRRRASSSFSLSRCVSYPSIQYTTWCKEELVNASVNGSLGSDESKQKALWKVCSKRGILLCILSRRLCLFLTPFHSFLFFFSLSLSFFSSILQSLYITSL